MMGDIEDLLEDVKNGMENETEAKPQ
jgi:hypothetical protein